LRFFELYVVLMFAAAWGILELVAKRFDQRPENSNDPPETLTEPDDPKPE
jgi:hypothetical protein